MTKSSSRSVVPVLVGLGVVVSAGPVVASDDSCSTWAFAGNDLQNTRNASAESRISPHSVSGLAVKWQFTTAGDVSATPAVDASDVYFPDSSGALYKLDRGTGALVWSHQISEYDGTTGAFARTTPAIAGDTLILGDQATSASSPPGASVFAIDKKTGALIWVTKLDSNPNAVITQSAVVDGNVAYVGVSSLEEGTAAFVPNYPCCTFRGSMVALDVRTGAILWQTYMAPALAGTVAGTLAYPGASVWGSTPVIDHARGSVYISTGNNYAVPAAVTSCATQYAGQAAQLRACIAAVPGSKDDHFDSILALNLKTGAIKWATSAIAYDAFTVGCSFPGGSNCPSPAGPDYDFGQGPALFEVKGAKGSRQLLGQGQKSGQYWALDPQDGSVVWVDQVGPGGSLGGLEWGSAVDGQRVYAAVSNSGFTPWTFSTGLTNGKTVQGGFWAAIDAATGKTLWETAASNPPAVTNSDIPANAIALNIGPVTVANGVSFAGAVDANGTMYAFDASSGAILWSFQSGGSVASGAAVVDGTVFWGCGYKNAIGVGTAGRTFYAFALPSKH
jgi:polyvinyl alcohol dehydrogenase (cytochrome)